MIELLEYNFIRHALITAALASIACGFIGTYIVSKRMVFISGGITHTSFGGIGIAYFLGANPLLGAAVFSILSAVGIEWLSKKSDIRTDSSIAIFWSFGMAVGIIFIFLSPGYAPNMMHYLFGSILTVTITEILLLLILTSMVVVFFVMFYHTLILTCFDEEFAITRNIPTGFFRYSMIILTALVIVMTIRVAGIILIISLLTLPQTTANLFLKKFSQIIFISILLGLAGTVGGLFLSYYLNIPSGACIVFLLFTIFLLGRLVQHILVYFKLKQNLQA